MNSIDYGMGKTNVDMTTGIRYGVISVNDVAQAWCDDAEPINSNACPKCGSDLPEDMMENISSFCSRDEEDEEKEHTCPHCNTILIDLDLDFQEPIGYKIDDGEYIATQNVGSDIFIIKSPYYTLCEFCSPCAPGAGYLTEKGDVRAYCFAADWFEDEKAPYDIYLVETNEKIYTAEVSE
jgi:hypothetical protein